MVKKQLKYKWKQRVKAGDKIRYSASPARVISYDKHYKTFRLQMLRLVMNTDMLPVIFGYTDISQLYKNELYSRDVKQEDLRPYGS